MVELKTKSEIDAMAAAGAVVAEALRAVAEHAKPGRSTIELDRVAADVLARHGATSPFLNYHPRWAPSPFPAVLCVSVNDAADKALATASATRCTRIRTCPTKAVRARACECGPVW